jgi:hypothetical protein
MSTEEEGKGVLNMVITSKTEAEDSAFVLQQQVGKCMVCGLPLGRKDDVVWCRRCGRLAHRNHLMEWIQTKKCCPACGARLDEKYYK